MKHIFLGAAALVLASSALAQNYIGGAIGPSGIDIPCGNGYNQCDDGDTGMKLYGGMAVPGSPLPGLSAELGYINFGEARASSTLLSATLYTRTVEASAFTFAAALRVKFMPTLHGVGRLGLAYVDAQGAGGLARNSSSSELNLYGGLGIEYMLNKQWKVTGTADFTSYDTGAESGSVNLLAVGVQYGF